MALVDAEIKMQGNDNTWFTTNAAVVYAANIQIFHTDGRYKFTDGVTALSALPFLGSSGGSQSLQDVTDTNNTTTNAINAASFTGSDFQTTLGFGVLSESMLALVNGARTSPLFEADNTTDLVKYKGVEVATLNDITQTITNGVTNKAPSEDVVYDAIALLQSQINSINPVGSKLYLYKNFK